MKSLLSFIALSVFSLSASAEVRLPNLFGHHMILQQDTSNAIWGRATPGEAILVEASWGESSETTAEDDGTWRLFLKTPKHGTGHSLTVRGDNEIRIKDVAIGEVWLCAGQSNMGWSTGNSFETEGEANVDLPNLRLFRSAREHWHQPLEENRDRLAQWKPCTPESAAETSAVSYYFAKTLHLKLGVPVGIIQRAYAGTPIEGWMPWELQKDDPRAIAHKQSLDDNAERQKTRQGKTRDTALAAFEAGLAEYRAAIDAGQTLKKGTRPIAPPIITQPADLGHQYPQNIYNAMIVPVRPYGIRGMLWYQGERNSKNAAQAFHYRQQLAQMVTHYRETWHSQSQGHVAKDFPVQFTQLPSWNPPQTTPVEGVEASWAVNRESMRMAAREIQNASMVVSIDTGDAVELHPKNKKPIGMRHALLALANTYGRDIAGSGPQFESLEVTGGKAVVSFSSTGAGLITAREGAPGAFAIAGSDREWHGADAQIQGASVVLSSPHVKDPVAVRYAWAMNPSQHNLLYNREGLPASPFRSDDWPLFDPDAEPIEVFKPKKPQGYVATDWSRPIMVALQDKALATTASPDENPASPANGLAPEVTDLNAKDVSYALEAELPDLEEPFINARPHPRQDGIEVAPLTREHGDRRAILRFAREIAAGQHGEVDSFLLMKDDKLIFESYYRRGRANYPHYQMSITKSYTAMALGRAIQLGHLSVSDLDRPVLGFLRDIDASALVQGADAITLAEAMNMRSGIRIGKDRVKELMRKPDQLKGQGQIQAYLQRSVPIQPAPREFKYQGSDPSIAMQVLEATVPGSARDFIETELLAKIGINRFAWQDDISGLPKAAAGSSMRSRDMLKWGMLVMNEGRWNGEQLIPEAFVQRATDRLHTNDQGSSYGFFWWRHDMEVGQRKFDCISGRGAGGQYILMLPELDLIAVITSHNKGMGDMLKTFPERVLAVLAIN